MATKEDPLVPDSNKTLEREEVAALTEKVENLETALGSRTLIGKAIGVLIEREGVNEEGAFEMLREASQQTNTKLRHLAAEIVKGAQPNGEEQPRT